MQGFDVLVDIPISTHIASSCYDYKILAPALKLRLILYGKVCINIRDTCLLDLGLRHHLRAFFRKIIIQHAADPFRLRILKQLRIMIGADLSSIQWNDQRLLYGVFLNMILLSCLCHDLYIFLSNIHVSNQALLEYHPASFRTKFTEILLQAFPYHYIVYKSCFLYASDPIEKSCHFPCGTLS